MSHDDSSAATTQTSTSTASDASYASPATTITITPAPAADAPPPPPDPSHDPCLAIVDDGAHDKKPAAASSSSSANEQQPPDPDPAQAPDQQQQHHDLFKLAPADALRLLAASVELLVRLTGDVPPTPPPRTPTDPQMSDITAEKASIARSHSDRSLALLRTQAAQAQGQQNGADEPAAVQDTNATTVGSGSDLQAYSAAMARQLMAQQAALSPTATATATAPEPDPAQPIDGVQLRKPPQPDPHLVAGADSQPVNLQHGAITRKFYSKKEPPISVQQYLQRLHQFCPMSTAVYLATSLYIHRLAVEERAIPVTRRNAHRLVLAGLRVAMKALEDLSYPHAKVARVGGVSEHELARLEISFCFLAGFALVVGEPDLRRHWEALRGARAQHVLAGTDVPELRLSRRPRAVPAPAPGVET